jgi:UDP-N-acetylmuramate--alanine ligase
MKKQKIYFIGIGGIGMSGLARYFKAHKYAVSGSDFIKSGITAELEKDAIEVKIGHRKANITPDIAFVVYNRAIPADNPELVAARALGVPAIPYAPVLGKMTEQYATIAITGSHGKSTTTALASLALIRGGLDPIVLIGTNLKEFGGKNFRNKILRPSPLRPSYLVLEADDFGAAFLEYSPLISIVTNIDKEHLDFYKTFFGVEKAFLKFMEHTREYGTLIVNRDDKNLFSLRKKISAIAKAKKLNVVWYSIKNRNSEIKELRGIIKIPGEHNLSNAVAVVELGKLLKIPKKKILSAIGSYTGAWRRMEYRGDLQLMTYDIKIYDDYAHHPTEIKATLRGFKEKFPSSPIICVFQPHQAKRLQVLFKEFTSAFNDADILILLPFYKVPGRDDSGSKYTSERLAKAITKKYPRKTVYYLENPRHIKKILKEILCIVSPTSKLQSPVLVMMGAGDIVNYTNILLE